jgi:hypothetical protein
LHVKKGGGKQMETLQKMNGDAIAQGGTAQINDQALFSVITSGDTSRLAPEQKLQYYKARCDAAGLDARTAPFQFLRLQGREILYALKSATDQLASKHGIRLELLAQATECGVRTVTVRAQAKDGRQTDEVGCVAVEGLKGDALCNAYMKAVTKAKRRAILSLCGLGMLDETEIETTPGRAPQAPKAARVASAEDPITDDDVPLENTDQAAGETADRDLREACKALADELKLTKAQRLALTKRTGGDFRKILAELNAMAEAREPAQEGEIQ